MSPADIATIALHALTEPPQSGIDFIMLEGDCAPDVIRAVFRADSSEARVEEIVNDSG
jgi:hypothetical protein